MFLHNWLLKVGAEMPPMAIAAELAAPVSARINQEMLLYNQEHHATLHTCSHAPHPPKKKSNRAVARCAASHVQRSSSARLFLVGICGTVQWFEVHGLAPTC